MSQRPHLIYNMPGALISGPDAVSQIASVSSISSLNSILLITDAILTKLGYTERVRGLLNAAGKTVIVFDDVQPEPSADLVRSLIAGLDSRIDGVVGLGGGSVMDVAKLGALLLGTPQDINSVYGVGAAQGARLPLVLVPTTAGTGSEVTNVAVVTDDEGSKAPALGAQFLCDTVILDPVLTLDCPPKTTAATGIDAMVHAIEAYTSRAKKNPVSDILALQALKLLFDNIRTAVFDGKNLEARTSMLNGAMLAGLAFSNATVGAVHALAYPIGGLFHVSHGGSNAVILAEVMTSNLPSAVTQYASISRKLLPSQSARSDHDAAMALINELRTLIGEIGLETRLGEYGIVAEDIPVLCDGAQSQARLLSYNIHPLERSDIAQIYANAL
jgi:alcohol dehydrogenase class IV